MLDNDGNHFYAAMLIIGPVLLALVLGWAMLRNRTSRRQLRETEAATRRVQDEQERIDAARDNG